jgi:hypothetical protein
MSRNVNLALTAVFLLGVLLGFFVLHDMRIAIPSTFFLGYFVRGAANQGAN